MHCLGHEEASIPFVKSLKNIKKTLLSTNKKGKTTKTMSRKGNTLYHVHTLGLWIPGDGLFIPRDAY